jgi:hypothetical protein
LRQRLARERLYEMIHAAGRLQQRRLPHDLGVAEDEVVPKVRAQDLIERNRVERYQRPVADAVRALETGTPGLVLVGIARRARLHRLGETAEIHQQVLEFLDVGLGQRQVDALGAHALAEHLGDVALQVVHRLAHLPGAAVADMAGVHAVCPAGEDVRL